MHAGAPAHDDSQFALHAFCAAPVVVLEDAVPAEQRPSEICAQTVDSV